VNTPPTSRQFAHELRRWREARRISQLDLALRAGTTQRHVSYMEQGRSRPGRTMVVRLRCEQGELQLMTTLTSFATALDVTLAELHLEAFLPANDASAQILREREQARREHGGDTGSLPPALVVS
jgi:transcriptional regulator with XRE-family HTH domain